jgi:hypothetical protein
MNKNYQASIIQMQIYNKKITIKTQIIFIQQGIELER